MPHGKFENGVLVLLCSSLLGCDLKGSCLDLYLINRYFPSHVGFPSIDKIKLIFHQIVIIYLKISLNVNIKLMRVFGRESKINIINPYLSFVSFSVYLLLVVTDTSHK